MARPIRSLTLAAVAAVLTACGGSGGGPGPGAQQQQLVLAPDALFQGTVTRNGTVLPGTSMTVGDAAISVVQDEEHRAFLSFNTTAGLLPDGATIVSATLFFSQTAITGDPYTNLGNILVDDIDMGPDLDAPDFDAGPFYIADALASNDGDLRRKQVDVTAAVAGHLANGIRSFSFRFRFETPTNDDGADDLATLEDPGNLPPGAGPASLVIVYTE